MAYSDEMHARQEFKVACQKRNLISELNEYQQVCSRQIANNEMMEGTIQSLREAHSQSLRTFREEQSQYLTRVFEEHHQSKVGILNERFAETEFVMELVCSRTSCRLLKALSERRKPLEERQAPLSGETTPPPGLRTKFEQAPERSEKPPHNPFEVPAGMKSFLDRLSNSPSITGLASPPTPRSLASAAPKGQPFPFSVEATTAPRLGNMPGSATSPDFAGFIEAQKAMLQKGRGKAKSQRG